MTAFPANNERKGYVDHWIDTAAMRPAEIEKHIREHQIDILIDLAGHTANNFLAIMARRPAPVQASWVFGTGQTTGLPEIDWFLTGQELAPPTHEVFMAEKVLRLPFAGMPYKPGTDYLTPTPLPCLHTARVVLGVLTRPLRTNHHTVQVWADILHQLPEAVLRFDHIPYAEPDIQARFKNDFAVRGIGPERLEFCNTRPTGRP